MKHKKMIQKFFKDITEGVTKEIKTEGEIQPRALLLVIDDEGEYGMCGMDLPSSFKSDEISLETIFHTKYVIGKFTQQVQEDGHTILAVVHTEMVGMFDNDEKLFIFKKVWNDDSEENMRKNSEFITIKRNDSYVNEDGDIIHDIDLVVENVEMS